MDIGFLLPATNQAGDLPTLARRVEALGFDSLWIPEHPIIPRGEHTPYPFGGPLPEHYGRWWDPFVALTVAAAVTNRIKLATGICLLPEREPMVTAKVVASLDEAIDHINRYGSHHTDAILTTNHPSAMRFLREVDSSSVMVNASTRFADGFEYGLGAEIGISTDKFHARGPVGIEGLTSLKYVVLGEGEVRP